MDYNIYKVTKFTFHKNMKYKYLDKKIWEGKELVEFVI